MIAVLLFLSFGLGLLFTPLLRNAFIWMGWVDLPDNVRKLHGRPIPRCGGIAIMLACVVSFGVGYLLMPSGAVLYIQHRVLLTAVFPATIMIFAVGVADDLLNLRPRYKLAGQFVASAFTVLMGAHLNLPYSPLWFSMIVSLIWLLACTNAVNLIDGMDGLAAGVSLLAVLTMLCVAVLHRNNGLLMATAPLVGALLGFLRYNFTPATVFLGDAGSLTIGFTLGCLGMVWSAQSGGFNLLGPLIALALPLVDVFLAISRRYLRRVPLFGADRGHIHHRVLALGFSPRRATFILYGCCVVFAVLALVESVSRREFDVVVLALFLLMILVGVRRLEYVEFRAVHRMLQRGELRVAVSEEIYLQEISAELSKAMTPEDCWKAMRRVCEDATVSQLRLQIVGREFHHRNDRLDDDATYSMHVPLGHDSSLMLIGSVPKASRTLNANIYQLQTVLRAKVDAFYREMQTTRKAA